MEIKFKKLHEKAVKPNKGTKYSVGLDLTAITKEKIFDSNGNLTYIEYDTKIAMEIPDGFGGFIFPRSSISKYNLVLANSVGISDPDYTGSLKIRFKVLQSGGKSEYEIGDKIAQLLVLPTPKIELIEVEELNKTERGEGGFGSTDTKEKDYDGLPYLSKSGAW